MEKFKQVMRTFGRQLKEGFRRRWWYLIIAAVAVALDQVTKRIAVKYLAGGAKVTFIKNFITWRYHENTGSAYGMFSDSRWVFMSVSIIGITAFLLYLFGKKTNSVTLDLGLAFIIGGGIGNMIDRVALGYVVDFIGMSMGDFYLFNFTCNVADIFVTVGGVMIFLAVLIQIIMEERNKKKQGDLPEDPIPAEGEETVAPAECASDAGETDETVTTKEDNTEGEPS